MSEQKGKKPKPINGKARYLIGAKEFREGAAKAGKPKKGFKGLIELD